MTISPKNIIFGDWSASAVAAREGFAGEAWCGEGLSLPSKLSCAECRADKGRAHRALPAG